mgnify:CR=1 FL=1
MGSFQVDLTGQVAMVTGAARDTGQAIALALARAGAAVCAVDVNPDRLDETVSRIEGAGGRALAWTGDISNRFQVAALIEATRDAFGGLHIVVNATAADKRAPLLALDEYDWRRALEISLTGAFFCTQLAARVMADEGGGAIVNVLSLVGPLLTAPEAAPLAASQAGLLGLTRQAARELLSQGVRVNAVCSGLPAEMPAALAVSPDDIAAAVLFLCSPAARAITGQMVVVDGGNALL